MGKTSSCDPLTKTSREYRLAQGFFLGENGGPPPPIRRKFCQFPPPHPTLLPVFWTKACPPPPPAEVRPRKFEKFEYIFVSNLTTFKLKSTLKKLYFMLKIAKNGLVLHYVGSFGFSRIFFASPPPPPPENFEHPAPSKI